MLRSQQEALLKGSAHCEDHHERAPVQALRQQRLAAVQQRLR